MFFIGSEEKCERKVNKYKMRAEKSTDNTGFTISSNESEEEATKLNSNTVNPRNSNLLNKRNNWSLLNYDKINNCFNFTVGIINQIRKKKFLVWMNSFRLQDVRQSVTTKVMIMKKPSRLNN